MFEIFSFLLAALFATGGGKPEIKQGAVNQLPPPEPPAEEPPPPRMPVPGLKWHERSGEIRVEAMAATPRFPAAPAGYQRVELAELVDHDGRAHLENLRILCDVFVEDVTDAASIVNLAMAVQAQGRPKPKTLPTFGHTAWGERLVRKFSPQHREYIGRSVYDGAMTLPTQLPTTPNVPLFTSDHCKTFDVASSSWAADLREVLQSWGVDTSERFYWIFDAATCGAQGNAYAQRTSTKTGKKYPRMYNLRLEARGANVVLTAEIARLPITQILKWRCYYAVT